jgi:hypothetical protein
MRLSLLPSVFLPTTTEMKYLGLNYFELIFYEIMHSEPWEMILLDKYLLFRNTKTNLICIHRLDIDFAQKNIWI